MPAARPRGDSESAARTAARAGTSAGLGPLATITLITSLINQAERCLPQLVHDARAGGHTWHEIAHTLSTSPDDAQLRCAPKSPVPTPPAQRS